MTREGTTWKQKYRQELDTLLEKWAKEEKVTASFFENPAIFCVQAAMPAFNDVERLEDPFLAGFALGTSAALMTVATLLATLMMVRSSGGQGDGEGRPKGNEPQ